LRSGPSIRPGVRGSSTQDWRCYSQTWSGPAASTFGNILGRAGLTSPQKKRNGPCPAQSRSFRSRVRINSGARISMATSPPGTASAVIHSQSPTRIAPSTRLPEFTYPKGLLLRRVKNDGDISWRKNRAFISKVFRFKVLAFELITPGFYRVFFRDMEIGECNVEDLRFRAARRVAQVGR